MNRYHQIYFNYLAKVQGSKKNWAWPDVGITGILIKYEYQPETFSFGDYKKATVKYRPAFKVWVQPAGDVPALTFFIEVSGTKVIADMHEYRKFMHYYSEHKIMAIGREFFEHATNKKNLKALGIWIEKEPRKPKAPIKTDEYDNTNIEQLDGNPEEDEEEE